MSIPALKVQRQQAELGLTSDPASSSCVTSGQCLTFLSLSFLNKMRIRAVLTKD